MQNGVKESTTYVHSHWEPTRTAQSLHPHQSQEGTALPRPPHLPLPTLCHAGVQGCSVCEGGLAYKNRSQRHLSLNSLFWSLKKSIDKSSQTALSLNSPCLHLKLLLVIRCWEKKPTQKTPKNHPQMKGVLTVLWFGKEFGKKKPQSQNSSR